MAEANILEALSRQGANGFLDSLLLYGKVRCAIKRPDIIGSKVEVSEEGDFAILDVFAVKCLDVDYFGNNVNRIYFTKGSMVIFIKDHSWVGEVVKVSGNYARYGVKVRQQYAHKTPYDGITALAFQRVGNNYKVVPNYIIKLGEHDEDVHMTPLEDFVVKLRSDEVVEYPITLDSIMEFNGVNDYEELDFTTTNNSKKKNSSFIDSNERVDVTKIDLNLTFHLEGQETSPYLDAVKEDIEGMKENRKRFAKDLFSLVSKSSTKYLKDYVESLTNIRDSFIDNVLGAYNRNIGRSNVKGRVYADEFVKKVTGTRPFDADEEFKMPSASDIAKSAETLQSIIQVSPSELKYPVEGIHAPMLFDKYNLFVVIVSITTGISIDSLESNYYACSRVSDISFMGWVYALLNMPYAVGIMGSSLSVVDCDKIYFSYTRFFTKGEHTELCGETRKDMLFLKSVEEYDDKNSFVERSSFSVSKPAYPQRAIRFLEQNGFPAKQDVIELLSTVCRSSVCLSGEEVNFLENMKWYTTERVDSLIDKGVLNSIDSDKGSYLVLERDYEKETLMYEILINKGHESTGITDEQISQVIEEFEESRGFKLESLQREGIKLCKFKAAVLSGCAGSGKTTTSDCITMCLQKYMSGYNIIYGTPTGKACRRLAEVVGGTVKTLHSQFGVSLSGEGYLTTIKKKYEDYSNPSKNIYLLDEMAMCNTDLLYEVVRSLGKEDMIYFLGDCKQLPPIGRGNPFYLLMKILPCVELGVSKRAAEGSLVNYNTTLINCMSDGIVQELAYDDSSFFCLECRDAEIPLQTTNAWKKFMSGEMNGKQYEEDDIQIISGYATPEKKSSSTSLNPHIQKFLRRNDKLLFRVGDMDFYKNDRVIHVRLNSYGTQRYVEVENNIFKSVVTLGIVNGEVGKLVGIVSSEYARFEDFNEDDLEVEEGLYGNLSSEDKAKLLNTRNEKEDKIRDDSAFKNPNYYFAKVKVYDTDLKRDVIVLYPARCYQQDDLKLFGGEDIQNLELAYALTTHKMQGSQGKVIMLPLSSDCNEYFINRNMLNTMITRSQEVVACIGCVKGEESPINKGRKHASELVTLDMLSFLATEE